ncbi:MAG: peptidase M22 [Ruminococcaceae bacterium]|nr:peptidase M22 [Oscillospiraceae bacterium]
MSNSYFLAIDTSNYTTSAALYCPESRQMLSETLLLPVKQGEKGLRQSDAVFLHTKQLSEILCPLIRGKKISAVGASIKPRNQEGSYMPCFLVGENTAKSIAAALDVPFYAFSHQEGHIAAALFGAGRLDLWDEKILAFHVSGGTTESVIKTEDGRIEILGGTADISAGQLIDRAGVMMGLDFPCGKQIEKLALNSTYTQKIKISNKNGFINLSGFENKAKELYFQSADKEKVASFVIECIVQGLEHLTLAAIQKHGQLPIIYSGGVMSCKHIQQYFKEKYGGIFSPPQYSCDNAAGIAVLTQNQFKRR